MFNKYTMYNTIKMDKNNNNEYIYNEATIITLISMYVIMFYCLNLNIYIYSNLSSNIFSL
jgi:hypothetical protein